MTSIYLKRECAGLWQQSGRGAAVVVFALLCIWSAASGLAWQAEREKVLSTTPADVVTERAQWLKDLEKIEAGEAVSPYAARPINYSVMALNEPAPLAALAYREEAIHPHSAVINGKRSEASLFQHYEVQGPSALWAGHFDLAFIIVALLPLLLLVLTFDVLSRERESGRLSLFLVQGGNVAQLVLARILVVATPLVLLPIFVVLFTAIFQGADISSTILWIITMLAYTAVWSGFSAWVALRFHTTASAALAVLAVWSIMVVFVPSGAQFLAEAVHPVPSRVTYLSEARDAEAAARRNITQRAEIYMAEHPDQADTPDEAVPGFYRTAYLANLDVNARTRPLVEQLESNQAAQRHLINVAGVLSPAIIAQRLLQDASKTGAAQSADFRKQARHYLNELLDRIGPATVGQSRLSLAQARSIPDFAYEKGDITSEAFLLIGWLLLLATGLALAVTATARGVGVGRGPKRGMPAP